MPDFVHKELKHHFKEVLDKYKVKDNPDFLAGRAWVHLSKGTEGALIALLAMPEIQRRAEIYLAQK